MTVFEDFPTFRSAHSGCVATIGKYDGLHLGHQHVLQTLRDEAGKTGLPAVVVLSEPHPEEFFAGHAAPPRLTHFEDKVDFLRDYGIDAIFKMAFNEALCNLSADEFIKQYLVEGLGVRALIVGDDFRFGKNREGDFDMLVEKSREYQFDVIREVPCLVKEARVSSTQVKEYLQQGDCEMVKSLLGRYYSIGGEVVEGKKLGRELGAPTANIRLIANKLPLQGIFTVLVELRGRQLKGVASVGFNPTVEELAEETARPKLEIHLFDFNENIYGEHLTVFFVKKLRDEYHFPDLESLKQQIALDISQAREMLKNTVEGNP